MPHLFAFGYGYTARRLAAVLGCEGWTVTGTSRDVAPGHGDVAPEGSETTRVTRIAFGGERPSPEVAERLATATHVLISIPPRRPGGEGRAGGAASAGSSGSVAAGAGPVGAVDPVDAVVRHHRDDLARSPALRWVGLLSTVGVYGDHDGGWVDESTPPRPGLERTRRRLRAEEEWSEVADEVGAALQIFRIAGIYGPGRSPLDRVAAPGARRIVKPGNVFNRIHVDDIVGIVEAGIRRPERTGVFNVSDEEPASSYDVLTYAAELLGRAPPPEVAFEEAGLSPMGRSFYAEDRRVRSLRVGPELGYRLRYPTYREGLRALAAPSEGPCRKRPSVVSPKS